MDASEKELLSNKNAYSGPISGAAHMNLSNWYNASGQLSDHLCGPENTRIFSFSEKNVSSLGDGNLNERRREFNNHFRNDSLVSLPLSKDPNYWSDNGISLAIPTGPNFTSADKNFNSLAPTFSKENGDFMLMGYHHNRADRGFPSMGQNFMRMETENGTSYNNVHENLVMSGAFRKKEHEHFTPVHTTSDIRTSYFASGDHIPQKLDVSVASRGITNRKGEGTNHSGNLTHNHREGSEVLTGKSTIEHSAYQTVTVAQTNTITVNNVPKRVEKAAKKNSANNFPSNVRSLLSTGILDGVPVKYVSWSREKSLRGIIKGTGYLCGCDDCKMKKNLNAFEFERHAGCKTKHPNNHIYFVSGKTIYSVVQDLKGTQQEMMFEAIKNVTGSPINVKNYRLWKASYQAATRELQRIYGKDR